MSVLPAKSVCATLGVLAVLFGAAGPAQAEQIVVELHPSASPHDFAQGAGLALSDSILGQDVFLFDAPDGDAAALLAALRAIPTVVWAELNHVAVAPGGETQSFFVSASARQQQDQYAIALLGIDDAHLRAIGAGVTVAVLDTGVWASHEVFAGQVLRGHNFIDGTTNTNDLPNGADDDGDGLIDEMAGHGTYVAGVVSTTAPGAAILPITVLNSDGVGSTFLIAQGIYHAIESGADVVNLSVATIRDTEVMRKAVADADAAGLVVVASVSNTDRQNPVSYPAAYPSVLAVAATDEIDHKAGFSDYGQYIALSAPGTDIVGPLPGNLYGQTSGASASAAFVSGTSALLLQDTVTDQARAFVEDALAQSSFDLDPHNPDYAGLLGTGRLQVDHALASKFVQDCADVNADAVIDVNDLLMYLDQWFALDARAERTGDWPASIDVVDLLQFLGDWFSADATGC